MSKVKKKDYKPIAPFFKELYLNEDFEDLNLKERIVYNVILFYSYRKGYAVVPDFTLRRYAMLKTDPSANRVVASLHKKGYIERSTHFNEYTNQNERRLYVVESKTPEGYKRHEAKVIPLRNVK